MHWKNAFLATLTGVALFSLPIGVPLVEIAARQKSKPAAADAGQYVVTVKGIT